MTSAVSEMRKEVNYVRDPGVHIRAGPGRIGDNPDNNQDHYDPAQNFRYQWFLHCLAKTSWLMSWFFPPEAMETRRPRNLCESQVPA
jgi:hypothetical protein